MTTTAIREHLSRSMPIPSSHRRRSSLRSSMNRRPSQRNDNDNDAIMKEKLDLILDVKSNVKIKDRRWRDLKKYKQCVLHKDVIDCIMTLKLKQQPETTGNDVISIDEVEAVRLANELVDVGYIRHVCNDHRFVVGESKTLYFRFQDDVIGADLHTYEQRHNNSINNMTMTTTTTPTTTDQEYAHEVEALYVTVERLCTENIETDRAIKEAYGKIAMLESILLSLTFGFGMIICILILAMLMFVMLYLDTTNYTSTSIAQTFRHEHESFLRTFLVPIVLPIIIYIGYNSKPLFWMSRIGSNLEILKKLFVSSGSLEDTMEAMTLDVEETTATGTDDTTSTAISIDRSHSQQLSSSTDGRRESLVVQMIRAVSQQRQHQTQQIQLRDASDLPHPSVWPHGPALLCVNTPCSPPVVEYGTGPLPIGQPFDFETELFVGKCLVRLRDVPSDDPDGDALYFDGRKRRFQAIVQGRFKDELKVSDVMTGHEFRPLQRLPPAWLVRAGTSFIRRIAPGTEVVLTKHESRAMSLLAATSQVVSTETTFGRPPECLTVHIRYRYGVHI